MGDKPNPWEEMFVRGVDFLVGEGRMVCFLFDNWEGVGPLSVLDTLGFSECSTIRSL